MVRLLPTFILLFLGTTLAQDVGTVPSTEPPIFALKGATVVVGSGEILNNVTVVLNDGLIQAIGTVPDIPPGAWELDLTGMFIYPGLIDSFTNIGVKSGQSASAPAPGRQQRGGSPQGSQSGSEEGPGYFAEVSAANLLGESDKTYEPWRSVGVTTLHVAPNQGIFQGSTAAVNLNGRHPDEMIVRDGVGMSMSFRSQGYRTYPGSLMGTIAHIRQTLYDARHYREAWEIYNEEKRGIKRPETDRTLSSLQPVLEGSMPLIFPAKTEREVRRAVALCKELQSDCIVTGGFEAVAAGDVILAANVPVLVSLNFPTKPKGAHPEADESLRALRFRSTAPSAALGLEKLGVKFAFCSDGAKPEDFVKNLRKAVASGLPKEAAVKAVTVSAAEILGINEQLGSIESGKIANLIVTDKDLFEEDSAVRHVFVDGVYFEVPKKKPPKGDQGSADDMSGSWNVTVSAPDQDHSLTFRLQQDGTVLTGSVETTLGVVDVQDGSVSGSSFSFKIELDFGMGPTEIRFSGTMTEDSLSGTSDVGEMGTAPLEGRRVP
jgi:imidazolonepropionase-like amidohydrolase